MKFIVIFATSKASAASTKGYQENSINEVYPIVQNFPIILFTGIVWIFIVWQT